MQSSILLTSIALLCTSASAQIQVQPRHPPQAAASEGGRGLRGLQDFEWIEDVEIDVSMSISTTAGGGRRDLQEEFEWADGVDIDGSMSISTSANYIVNGSPLVGLMDGSGSQMGTAPVSKAGKSKSKAGKSGGTSKAGKSSTVR
eukprot:CAMPEP_0183783032 /NCGR_PEP_ID=MMETSP0739-20130205/62528_1 /TAXON_ID=385413 /ORGANISM="Thalassiosira miniscula, Strain CCMP1093" /LENGTH=144 /DNA_ID=CAMNT_0026026613 /DNA_START=55 /DNA_END=489 /DNA_ORIENTATION=-